MWIFAWDKNPARGLFFDTLDEAWGTFGNLTVIAFPHYIFHVNIDDGDGAVTTMNSSQFINYWNANQ